MNLCVRKLPLLDFNTVLKLSHLLWNKIKNQANLTLTEADILLTINQKRLADLRWRKSSKMLFGSCLATSSFLWNGSLTMKRTVLVRIDCKSHPRSISSSVFYPKTWSIRAKHEQPEQMCETLMIVHWLERKMEPKEKKWVHGFN